MEGWEETANIRAQGDAKTAHFAALKTNFAPCLPKFSPCKKSQMSCVEKEGGEPPLYTWFLGLQKSRPPVPALNGVLKQLNATLKK